MLKARIGLYSAGLNTYWAQFAGLKDRLLGYNSFIAEKLSQVGEVYNFGLVDDETAGRQAGEYFNAHNVDIIFAHSATYFTSSTVLPGAASVVWSLHWTLQLPPDTRMRKQSSSLAGRLSASPASRSVSAVILPLNFSRSARIPRLPPLFRVFF